MTRKEIYEKCKNFKPGDQVTIPVIIRDGNKIRIARRLDGTVLERCPHFLMVKIGSGRECFSYSDIVLFGAIEKKKDTKIKKLKSA
jgi:hypothetical protein